MLAVVGDKVIALELDDAQHCTVPCIQSAQQVLFIMGDQVRIIQIRGFLQGGGNGFVISTNWRKMDDPPSFNGDDMMLVFH